MAIGYGFNRRVALSAGITLWLAAAGFWFFKRRSRAKEQAQEAALESPSIGKIEERFRETGSIAAQNFVNVASKAGGRVVKIAVREGQTVKKGDILAVIQPGKIRAERYVPVSVAAPISGVVMRYVRESSGSGADESKFIRLGDYVAGLFDSQQPTYLMTVADLSRLVVLMDVGEMDILKLAQGMPVRVTVDALPGEVFRGRVMLIPPQAQKNSDGVDIFRVVVSLDRADPRLKIGMTAQVDALVKKKDRALKVPLDAVFESGGKDCVYVQALGAKPRKVMIKTGLRSDMEAEVLKAGGELGPADKLLTEKPSGL
ncbi:MAG: efflux RND transporter periplasmic adaptor subunit [Elusimicrobiota bacterium]